MARSIVLELQEGNPCYVSREFLSGGFEAAIHRCKHFDLAPDFEPDGNLRFAITARNTIGHIPISASDLVRVSPKLPIRSIFGMLEVAYDLKSLRLLGGLVDAGTLEDLYERLAAILAQLVLDRARRGLYRAYVDHAEPLSYVRGRLDLRASCRLLASASPTVFCEFQEHTADVEENQILLWTLHLLCKARLHRDHARNRVRAAYRACEGAMALKPFSASDCANRMYNRLNQDYQPLHALCRFFLDGLGPGSDRGDQQIVPYTVNMPILFEAFVAQWLTTHIPTRFALRIKHALRLNGAVPKPWAVDILIEESATGRPIAVLDTKYKAHRQPGPHDIQQIVAYAVECRVKEAYLVYPSADILPSNVRVGDVAVKSVFFDLAAEVRTGGYGLLGQLSLGQ